jgi:hypothetical protein
MELIVFASLTQLFRFTSPTHPPTLLGLLKLTKTERGRKDG